MWARSKVTDPCNYLGGNRILAGERV